MRTPASEPSVASSSLVVSGVTHTSGEDLRYLWGTQLCLGTMRAGLWHHEGRTVWWPLHFPLFLLSQSGHGGSACGRDPEPGEFGAVSPVTLHRLLLPSAPPRPHPGVDTSVGCSRVELDVPSVGTESLPRTPSSGYSWMHKPFWRGCFALVPGGAAEDKQGMTFMLEDDSRKAKGLSHQGGSVPDASSGSPGEWQSAWLLCSPRGPMVRVPPPDLVLS